MAQKSYTDRSNARRAAKKALTKLGCFDPDQTDYKIIEQADGTFVFELSAAWTASVDMEQNPATKAQAKAQEADAAAIPDVDVQAVAEAAGTLATDAPAAAPQGKRAEAQAKAVAAAEAGEIPKMPACAPSAQPANVKRAQAIHDAAQAGDRAAVEAIEITGKAHSADRVRRYRDLVLVALKAKEGA